MNLSRLYGHASTTFYSHSSPLALTTKDGKTVSLLDICKDSTPPCYLNPFLFNGHLQTIYTAIKWSDIPIYYKRRIFEATLPEVSGIFAVDFVVPPYAAPVDETLPPRTTYYTPEEFDNIGSDDEKPMLITLHGLSGGSHEIYLRSVLDPLFRAGWAACVVNSRGCAMSKISSGVLYNARATWDVRQVVTWAREKWPRRKLFGIGFSLGANILTNYLGEEGSGCLLQAAVVCSNPWNLEVGSLALQRSTIGMQLYSRAMGTALRKLFERHVEQLSKNPRIDIEKVRAVRYLHEFDRVVQGPSWNYPCETAYYRDASSSDSLFNVKIPLFAIHAEDDPIAVREALPFQEIQQTPFAVLCTTTLGGHLSWFELGGTRWFAKPATNFLMKIANEISLGNSVRTTNDPVGEQLKLDEAAPQFLPMRRKLQMHMDLL